MRHWLRSLVQRYGGWQDINVDAHVYGGGVILALGVATLWKPGAGVALFGAFLVFLGLWRR